eukprot:12955087-Alexandrium_andersonii.AAC.1
MAFGVPNDRRILRTKHPCKGSTLPFATSQKILLWATLYGGLAEAKLISALWATGGTCATIAATVAAAAACALDATVDAGAAGSAAGD